MADAVNESSIQLELCKCGSSNLEVIEGITVGRRLWYAKCLNCGREGKATRSGSDDAKKLWNEKQRKWRASLTEITMTYPSLNECPLCHNGTYDIHRDIHENSGGLYYRCTRCGLEGKRGKDATNAILNWNRLYVAKCSACDYDGEPELLYRGDHKEWKCMMCPGCEQKSPDYNSTWATLEIWNSMQETEPMEETESVTTDQKLNKENNESHGQINHLHPCPCCDRPVIYDKSMCQSWTSFGSPFTYNVMCYWCGFSSPLAETKMSAEIEWNRVNRIITEGKKAMQETTSITTMERRQGDRGASERSETVATGQESSVEIAQGSKGERRVTVKVYHADVAEARRQAIDEYFNTLAELDARNI
jgi:hypothetical protein